MSILQEPDDDAESFRVAMRGLAGSVAILTTARDCVPYGITITALMSLSLSPPALAIAVNKSASITAPLLERGAFCVNLLHQGHEEFCRRFATGTAEERIASGAYQQAKHGLPYLEDAQAAIFCTIGSVLDFGSHHLIVGKVDEVINAKGIAPLVYFDGDYAIARRRNGAAQPPAR